MSEKQKLLNTEDEKKNNKDELRKSAFFVDKKRERKNIKDYIFNDLKITDVKGNKNLLTKNEEINLFKKYKRTGDKMAFDKIIVSNLRFVVYMAKCFYAGLKSQYNCKDIYLDDLIQVGNLGLIKAAQNYILEGDCRFLSYAQHVIKSNFIYYIKKENRFFGANLLYGIPDCKIKKMNKYMEEFLQENQREPHDEELQNFYREENSLEDFSANTGYYRHLTEGTLSLDMNIQELSKNENVLVNRIREGVCDLFASDDEETSMGDLLVDAERENKQPMERESLAYDINRVLHKVDSRKRAILEMYYGLNGHKKYSIKEIANKLGLTPAGINWQKEKALEIIRNELIKDGIISKLLRKYL